jgi:glycosyltransferase involved in cell wall biosynthesis
MKLGVDITFNFDQYANRGIGIYGKNIVKEILESNIPNLTVVLFGFKDLKDNLIELKVKKPTINIEFVSLGNPRNSNFFNILYFNLFYKRLIKRAKLDVYFAPNFERGLPINIVKTAVVVHDVIPYVTKKYAQKGKLFNFIKGLFYNFNLNKAKGANSIITCSDFSKRELINKANFDPDKVDFVHLSISDKFRAENISTETRDVRRILVMYKITKPYFLYYGGLESNKNVSTILHAFSKVTKRHPDLKLVIAGKDFKVGWDNKVKPLSKPAKQLLQEIISLKLRHKIIITGEVKERHLPTILQNSMGFIHLSTYEGFGFSVLEAAASGTPVITTRRSSYPEILQEVPEYVDIKDIDQIANAIFKITQDEKHRNNLINKGITLSKKYSWKKTLNETLLLINKLDEKITPINITYVIPYFYPFTGGAENNCLALAKAMANIGHKVTVLTSDYSLSKIDQESFVPLDNIEVKYLKKYNKQYYLGFYPKLLKEIVFSKSDVIHVHGFGFIWQDFCLIIKKIISRKTRFINTPHGPFMALNNYSKGAKILKFLYTLIQRLFVRFIYNKIIQVNPKQYLWLSDYGINRNNIELIENGIDNDFFEEEDISEIKTKYSLNRKIVISFVGRFEQYKGVQDILTALQTICNSKKNIKFIAMGNEGAYLETLKAQIVENKLEKYVEILITPSNEIIRQILSVSQIFILPSQWEAFGISIVEAMAKGNAIITTRTEGGEYLIKDKNNGYLFDYGDTQELLRLIENMINDKVLLANIQEYNKEYAKQFTWDNVIKKYNYLLKNIIK